MVRELLKLMDIQSTITSGYCRQCIGAVERLHATLTTMMSQYVSTNQKDWDQCLPVVTGFSPFLVYGQEPVVPSEVCLNQGVAEAESRLLRQKWKKLLRQTAENLRQQQEMVKQQCDPHRRVVEYHPGQEVLIYTPIAEVPTPLG
ncbi:hypothetical protein PR048_017358 [Dryococelus australis]|uniref:Integrase catalytic domain-containing protein n=1 Tax=Dryococelus australis TaxID=614101 RepID=A0ABQ9H9H4_9NEOP|nr:hypothetical protein PR048_017358 [Dryococelus australis]